MLIDCLVYKMLFIKKLKPILNSQTNNSTLLNFPFDALLFLWHIVITHPSSNSTVIKYQFSLDDIKLMLKH